MKGSRTLDILPEPPKENLVSHFILGEIIDHIDLIKDEFPKVKIHDLKTHLWDIRNKSVEPEKHLRGFLKVFEETEVFKDAFAELDEGMQRQLKTFLAGGNGQMIMAAGGMGDTFALPPSPPVKHHFRELLSKIHGVFHHDAHVNGVNSVTGANGVIGTNRTNGVVVNGHQDYPRIFEDESKTKIMEVYNNVEFQNWGQSVLNTPLWTFVPKTVLGLQNLVKWAKLHDFRVRCSGYRHSWSTNFSQDKQILVSLLNLNEVTKLPDPMSIEPEYIDPENDLKRIELTAPHGIVTSCSDKALCRVGVAVTNEQFRRWAVSNDQWTLPVDVILVE